MSGAAFRHGDPVSVELSPCVWTTGMVVRQNRNTVRVALDHDIYRNGTTEERYVTDHVFHACDRPVPYVVGGIWRRA